MERVDRRGAFHKDKNSIRASPYRGIKRVGDEEEWYLVREIPCVAEEADYKNIIKKRVQKGQDRECLD
jgi:hypothetical protein